MLKAVFLDWYGTLSTSRFYEHWSAEGHPRHEAFDRFQTWWRAPNSQPFLDDWVIGRHQADDFLAEMAVILNLPLDELRGELIESVRHWSLIEPETGWLVQALRERGVRVVLATDNVDAWLRWSIPAMGLTDSFDAILSSHERRCFKGNAEGFFRAYLEAEGIGSGESVLIDDSVGLAPIVEHEGIRFLHAPFGTGPGAHLRALLALDPDDRLDALDATIRP